MRIAHIFHTYYPVLGGMERVVQRLAEEQMKLAHRVHVVTSMYGVERRTREEIINGVYVHRLFSLKLYYPDLTFPLEKCFKVLKNVDVIHVHSQNSLFNVILARTARRMGKQLAMDFLALDYSKSHKNLLVRFFGSYYQEKVQREAVKIVNNAITLNERDYRSFGTSTASNPR